MNKIARQTHRVISMIFMLTVLANIVAMAMNPGQQPPPYIVYSPLPFLFILMLSGIYLFVLPYLAKQRRA